MLRAAGRVVVVADSSKFGHRSLTLVSPLEEIDVFVSDDGLDRPWRDAIAAADATLVVATVPAPESQGQPISHATAAPS
jgi:DeoR/GlpR family transcriptional regulator of sugar metabolism